MTAARVSPPKTPSAANPEHRLEGRDVGAAGSPSEQPPGWRRRTHAGALGRALDADPQLRSTCAPRGPDPVADAEGRTGGFDAADAPEELADGAVASRPLEVEDVVIWLAGVASTGPRRGAGS